MTARTVVVADDNADVRRLVRHHLETTGAFDVAEAVDGYDALLTITGLAEMPEAVVLDQRMPGITGLEAAGRLRHRLPTVPVILYSAYLDDDGVREEAGRLGVAACVPKEDFAKLPTMIRALDPGELNHAAGLDGDGPQPPADGDFGDPSAPDRSHGPAPYGWRRVPARIEPDPDEQPILRAILAGHDAGRSYRSIARSLDDAGYHGRRGGTWSATQVSRIVRDHRGSPRPIDGSTPRHVQDDA